MGRKINNDRRDCAAYQRGKWRPHYGLHRDCRGREVGERACCTRATKASGNASMSGRCLPRVKKFLPRNLIGAIKASADPAPNEETLHRPNPIPTYAIWEKSTLHTVTHMRNAASNARLFEAAGGYNQGAHCRTYTLIAAHHIILCISVTRLRTELG